MEKESKYRKQVFDEFIEKTKYIKLIVEDRFTSIKKVYYQQENSNESNVKIDPLSAYLEHENITYEKLLEFLKSIGQRAKKPFKDIK